MTKDTLTLSLAMFALLFGAGNVIFPPALGVYAGSHWALALCGFLITAVVLGSLAIIILNYKGSLSEFGAPMGKYFIKIYAGITLAFIIGLFIIPRTAATSYEIALKPFNNHFEIIYYILYFFMVGLFAIKPSKVLDYLGKFLSPILIILLFYLIIKGALHLTPHYTPTSLNSFHYFSYGFIKGYQTGDGLGALLQANLAISLLLLKGYHDFKVRKKIIIRASLLNLLFFSLIYGGMVYLGACLGDKINLSWEKTSILNFVVNSADNHYGTVIFDFVVFFACFTSGVGGITMVADFFSKNFPFLKYPLLIIFQCILYTGIALLGVDSIIYLASPLLKIAYPILIMLVILHLLNLKNTLSFKLTIYTALFFSLADTLSQHIFMIKKGLSLLPFYEEGFVWFLPSIAVLLFKSLIFRSAKR